MRCFPAYLFLTLMFYGCESAPRPPKKTSSAAHPPRLKVGNVLNCSKLVHRVKAIYPDEARSKSVRGTVRLKVVVTKTGELRDFEAMEGDPLLVPAAIEAAKQWRYTPCLLEGTPVEVITVLDFRFPPD